VGFDLFLFNNQHIDLSTLSNAVRFGGGSIYHYSNFSVTKEPAVLRLAGDMGRYLTRPLGLEAVLRLRTSRGISMNGFHGHFFVRSQDLLALPCVSPDHGYTFQLTIEEELGRHNGNAFFQSALLYTSSNGQRRIRVHTLALPVVKDAGSVFAHADTVAITALLAKLGESRT
jgi:protein transport protein SEC24